MKLQTSRTSLHTHLNLSGSRPTSARAPTPTQGQQPKLIKLSGKKSSDSKPRKLIQKKQDGSSASMGITQQIQMFTHREFVDTPFQQPLNLPVVPVSARQTPQPQSATQTLALNTTRVISRDKREVNTQSRNSSRRASGK